MTNQHNDRDNDKNNEALSAYYQSISDEKPSIAADNDILQLARKAAQTQRQVSWLKRWSAPVSVAAVVVLSFSIVSVIQEESTQTPEMFSNGTESTSTQSTKENRQSPRLKQKIIHKTEPAFQAERSAPIARQKISAPKKASGMPAIAPSSSKDAQDSTSPLFSIEPPPMEQSIRSSKPLNAPAATKAPTPEIESSRTIGRASIAETQDKKAAQRKPEQATQLKKEIRLRTQQIQTAKSRSQVSSEAATSPGASFFSKGAIKPDLTTADRMETTESKRLVLPHKQKSKTSATLCAKTSHATCLASALCTLVKDSSTKNTTGLRCIEAKSHCEKDFIQNKDSAKQCQNKPGCWYRPGKCQCNELGECRCEKSGPPMCAPNS